MAFLRVNEEDGSTRTHDLAPRQRLVIGRQPDCELVIGDQKVSRRHASLSPSGDAWLLRDEGSSTGTFVNGSRVVEHSLRTGDEIRIGSARIVFDGGSAPARAKPGPGTGAGSGSRRVHPELVADETTDTFDQPEPEVLESRKPRESESWQAMRTVQGLDIRQLLESENEAQRKTLGQSESQLIAVLRIADELRKAATVDEVCERSVELAMRATSADRGLLALKDGEGFITRAERVTAGDRIVDGSVRVSRTFVRRVLAEKAALLAKDVASDAKLASAKSVLALGIRSVVCVPLLDASDKVTGFLYLDKLSGGSFSTRVVDLLCLLGMQAAAEVGRLSMVEQVREEQERRRTLARFFSADVVKLIEDESRKGSDLSGVRSQVVTVLFSDMQGFTALSEKTEPEALQKFLDVYFDRMVEILVDRWGGTLDKYIGDAIMGLFGAPYSKGPEADAKNAVSAALDMLAAVESLRNEFPAYSGVHMRIGINSGRLLAGMLGCGRRREYSVLGDVVNVASRLESTGEPGRIQIGETTHVAVRNTFRCEPAGERKLKNRERPVRAFWVVGPKG